MNPRNGLIAAFLPVPQTGVEHQFHVRRSFEYLGMLGRCGC
jgi:hypothetical protein